MTARARVSRYYSTSVFWPSGWLWSCDKCLRQGGCSGYQETLGKAINHVYQHQQEETDGMSRTRKSARNAGSRFEREMADYFAQVIDSRIDRQVKTGSRDKGDLSGVRTFNNEKIAVEVKDVITTSLSTWASEAEKERINLGGVAGVVAHKRHGKGDPAEQWVTMTAKDFAAIVTGVRPEDSQPKIDRASRLATALLLSVGDSGVKSLVDEGYLQPDDISGSSHG